MGWNRQLPSVLPGVRRRDPARHFSADLASGRIAQHAQRNFALCSYAVRRVQLLRRLAAAIFWATRLAIWSAVSREVPGGTVM